MTDDPFFDDVEKGEDGRPILLSRWGWKKIVFNQKTFLVAATREEALDALRTAGEDDPESLVDGCASKTTDNLNCYNTGDCKKKYCITRTLDTGIRICACTDTTP